MNLWKNIAAPFAPCNSTTLVPDVAVPIFIRSSWFSFLFFFSHQSVTRISRARARLFHYHLAFRLRKILQIWNLSLSLWHLLSYPHPRTPLPLTACTQHTVAKGRTNIELREQFILADGVSQTMTAFRSKPSPTSTLQRTQISSTNAGPITKVRGSSLVAHRTRVNTMIL